MSIISSTSADAPRSDLVKTLGASQHTEQASNVQSESEQPTVLLIDDSIEILRLLQVRLRSEDINLVTATNAMDGLRIIAERKPSLILLDLDMPVMDGFEALRILKSNTDTMDIPVIVISGSDATDDKVTGFEFGAIDYVCKPFNMPELRARIRSALRVQQLMQMLAQKAQIDGLTGLWNRAHFDDRLAEEVAGHIRTGRPFTLVLCDLDHFKSLNDTHGHPAGDGVLEKFGKILTSTLRRSDIACRYGGEEFGLILRETDAEQARPLIERVRQTLEETHWPNHPERQITASFGVCDMPVSNPSKPASWLETVDKALYEAKRLGRNRLFIAGDPINDGAPLAKAG